MKQDDMENATKTFHQILIASLQVDQGVQSQNKWACPIACFLAISFMKEDGNWQGSKYITPPLAQWTYCLRSIVLTEMVAHQDDFNGNLVL